MRLTVTFSGGLPSLLGVPARDVVVEVPEGSTIDDVIRLLDVTRGPAMAYAVNGRLRPPEFRPSEGDEIKAIAAIAGG